jgi:hypothetical protein
MSYAEPADLLAYVGAERTLPDNDEQLRLLARASEIIDDATFGAATADDLDVDQTTELAKATCAQVEGWLEWGEEQAITGQSGSVGLGGLNIGRLPGLVYPRTRIHLRRAGLLSAMVGVAD